MKITIKWYSKDKGVQEFLLFVCDSLEAKGKRQA